LLILLIELVHNRQLSLQATQSFGVNVAMGVAKMPQVATQHREQVVEEGLFS
jgi:hypothetical protein